MACFRCGRRNHYANNCYAKTSIHGKYLDSESDSSEDEGYSFQPKKKARPNPTVRPHVRHDTTEATQPQSSSRAGVYVLRTVTGMYYVGKSNDVNARIHDHQNGSGAACLDGSPFQVVTNLLSSGNVTDLESWERNETLQRMRTHGIDNVRGWMFTSTILTEKNRQDAFNQICEKFDLCRRCGRSTHFAEQCFARTLDGWAGGGAI